MWVWVCVCVRATKSLEILPGTLAIEMETCVNCHGAVYYCGSRDLWGGGAGGENHIKITSNISLSHPLPYSPFPRPTIFSLFHLSGVFFLCFSSTLKIIIWSDFVFQWLGFCFHAMARVVLINSIILVLVDRTLNGAIMSILLGYLLGYSQLAICSL